MAGISPGIVLKCLSLMIAGIACVRAMSYQGELQLTNTDGGLFGSVTDGTEAWFGVDGYPAKVVRIRLGLSGVIDSSALSEVASGEKVGGLQPMQEVSRLEFLPDEERLWSLTAEPLSERTATSWFAYAGVGNPPGRLVKVDLLQMKRVGYVQLSDMDIRGGIVLGKFAYFVTSAKPSTVLRCPTHDMFHGDTFHPVEVTLALGEHSVQAVIADETQEHILLGTYTQPARVVKLSVPEMTRSASLQLPIEDQMIYCAALWGSHAIFGTSTLPGRLVKVHVHSLTHVKSVELKKGEDRAVSVVVWGGQAFVGMANEWEQDTSSIVQIDLETMIEVAALVTPAGCTWLYAAAIAKEWAFFGSRYHGTSVVTRIGLPVSRPDVPEVPTGNATGQDAIKLSWERPFPRYHTGGAPILGARVLVRPAWHWDWTSEHVYGAAAPDPYAPKSGIGRIVRVHEDPADLLDGGYGAIVDGLEPMEEYKFAVILTNSAGPSHRSRSSEAVAGQMWMRHYLLHPQHLSDVECVVISSLLLLALAALTWALMGVAWSARKGSPDRVRAWAVVGSWALWGVMTSSLAMLMAWSGSSPSPQGKTIALSVTTQILFVFFLGACGETAMALHIQKQKHPSGTTPSAASLPDWVTAL